MSKYTVHLHVPRGSADAEYQVLDDGIVIAIIDPMQHVEDPMGLAKDIANSLNALAQREAR